MYARIVKATLLVAMALASLLFPASAPASARPAAASGVLVPPLYLCFPLVLFQ